MNLPHRSTAKAAAAHGRIAGHSPTAAVNAPGVVLRETAAGVGAALAVAAAANLLLLWLGIAPTPACQKGVLFARAEASYVGLSRAEPCDGLGRDGGSNSQARLMLETGLLF